jgi:hypothetical protein
MNNNTSKPVNNKSKFLSEAEKMHAQLGNAMCLAKWKQVSLHLPTGLNNSCYHPPLHPIDADALKNNPEYLSRLRVVLVTARQAPAHERAVNTIRSWGLKVDEAFFLGGIAKSKVLNVIRPLIFFDDQQQHFLNLEGVAAVHIPFGISSENGLSID